MWKWYYCTLAPQWAAISSKGAFWNFSTTCLLRSLSCSSIPTLSTRGRHKPKKLQCLVFVIGIKLQWKDIDKKIVPMAFFRVSKVISSAGVLCRAEQEILVWWCDYLDKKVHQNAVNDRFYSCEDKACRYLLFLWTVSWLHLHLQRDRFPDALPLRQTVLI